MEGNVRRYNSTLIRRKNQAKFEYDSVSRNGHKIKITQPNSMILVSFSSAEDVLFNDVKAQSTVNQPFRFFGTPGRAYLHPKMIKFDAVEFSERRSKQ